MAITGADSLRGSTPSAAVVAYKGDTPVAVIMPLRSHNIDKAEIEAARGKANGEGEALARKRRKRELQALRPAIEDFSYVAYQPGRGGLPGTIHGNAEATGMLSLLAGIDMVGLSFTRKKLELYIQRAQWELYQGGHLPWERAELRLMIGVLRQAIASSDRSFVYAEDQSPEEMKRTLREERFHAQQRRWLGFGTGDQDHIDTAALFADPSAQVAREHLLDIGYPDHPDVLAAEIGAKLAAGSWEELGLDEDEARKLFYQYATLAGTSWPGGGIQISPNLAYTEGGFL